MKTVTIRESAWKACQAMGYGGPDLLFSIIGEAFGGEKPEFPEKGYPTAEVPVYEAIAPDIIKSVSETYITIVGEA